MIDRRDRGSVALLVLLSSLAFIHLTAIPAFVDEGAQLRLIRGMMATGDWMAPLGYGKPLEVWPMVPLLFFGIPSLVATRAVHVCAGILCAVLTYFLARRLSDRPVALVCGALFAICPLAVYVQRFAFSDILLCAAGLWVLLATLRFFEEPTWGRSAALAAALLLGACSKLPVGFVLLCWLPLALAFMPAGERRSLVMTPAWGRLLASHAPAIGLALAVFVVAAIRLRLGRAPGFGLQDLVAVAAGPRYDIGAIIGVQRPSLTGELAAQLSWPVLILAMAGIAASAFKGDWRQRWLLAVGLLPLLAIGLGARFWYGRYLVFTLPPLLICAVLGWRALAAQAPGIATPLRAALLACAVGPMAWQSALLVLRPQQANWSALDRFQYFEGWTSGFGFPQAAQFILATADKPAMIYTLDNPSAFQLRAYLPREYDERVTPASYGTGGALLPSAPARLRNLLDHVPAWIVMSAQLLPEYMDSDFGPAGREQLALRPVAQFDKPGGRVQLVVYQVTRASP